MAGRPPLLELLAELQTAHLLAVPFENLDVFHRRGVTTDIESTLVKIVERRRGGWCFELNGGFGWLLRQIRFDVDYVSCRVADGDGWGPPLDHCALVVHLDGERYFVDVGFGDCCMIPVLLTSGVHPGVPRSIRCTVDDADFVIAEHALDGTWNDQLWGAFEPRSMEVFTSRSDYLQTEPGLSWTTKPFATRATGADGSRITYRGDLLRTRIGSGEFVDEQVDPERSNELLQTLFGLDDRFDR